MVAIERWHTAKGRRKVTETFLPSARPSRKPFIFMVGERERSVRPFLPKNGKAGLETKNRQVKVPKNPDIF